MCGFVCKMWLSALFSVQFFCLHCPPAASKHSYLSSGGGWRKLVCKMLLDSLVRCISCLLWKIRIWGMECFFFFLEFFYDSHLSLPSLPLDIKQRKVCRKNMSWNIWLNHDFMHISTKKDLAPDRFGQPPLTLLIPDNKLAINLQWSQSRHPHFSVDVTITSLWVRSQHGFHLPRRDT